VFADISNGKQNIKRGIVVYDYQLKDPQHFFRNEISYDNSRAKGKIESGHTNLGNVKVAFLIQKSEPKIDQSVIKLLTDKGYKLDQQKVDYITGIYYGKLVGRSRSIQILYVDKNEDFKSVFKETGEYLTLDN
jgi:hypothetical protein